ncbi:hypothetical protein RWV98_06625 [Agathobaculum sp. NTUH-O15-33]|uniref:hypothetical protein n=1 Tax=Agathobaculum sp. NTUH-O15-33 TaxID=3079302 RepID=UPI00295895DF|nr:hypothetical protein [Agathobaculum sp. NTUH-O15-33]WNX85937.1 hypothetical protein RWV98_06625 [Agathobaculum sp. NTUH-O15-33]
MKRLKRLLTAALCVATIASGTTSASAASSVGQEQFTDGEYSFQRVKVTFAYGVAMLRPFV